MLHANRRREDGVSDPALLQSRGNGAGEGRQACSRIFLAAVLGRFLRPSPAGLQDCWTIGMVVVPQGLNVLSTLELVKEKWILWSNSDCESSAVFTPK